MNSPRVRLGDLSVGFIDSLAGAMRGLDHDPKPLLDSYGLDTARLATPRARLSIPRYMRLGHAAIEQTGAPELGLLMGQAIKLGQLGLAGVTAMQAPTVRDAARTLTRFEPLYASNYRGQSSLHEDPQGAWLRFYSISPYNAYNRFVIDSVMSGWLQQLSNVCGEALSIDKVQIEFEAPAYSAHYQQRFACPVEFASSHNQLRLNQASLSRRNPNHCPSTWLHLMELCEQQLEQLTRTRSLREQITLLLGPLLHGREPDLNEVAARLQLPSWTLRRKLAEEGTQFRSILNETRRDLAMAYIRDTELAFGEIAYLLGFASAEAFQRAFKRWNQQTPGEFRRSQRNAG
ncbi:MAG: AraC family transcriptional regulator [Pseudomonas marincola]|uniref:AraC family transcriptional regulator n=1 Tax=Pseudomonas marincola TaxID=437900 RepID=UPI0030029800